MPAKVENDRELSVKSCTVEKSGPLCTVQDLGRATGRRMGLSPGGAMDRGALMWANRILGNDVDAPALEISLGGTVLRFDHDATVAITGADCRASLDGEPCPPWRTTAVRGGQTLRLGYSATGMRAYVAFPGGLDAPTQFGSASVVLREGHPGRLGRAVRPGDELMWHGRAHPGPVRVVPPEQVPQPIGATLRLPLTPGYEWDAFESSEHAVVWDAEWKLDPSSDRVATRLTGPALISGPRALDSTPLVDGTVQVPGIGMPLVFMRDRPTIGGYPKLGSVEPLALDSLAQARPGTLVRFIPADAAECLARLRRHHAFFHNSHDRSP